MTANITLRPLEPADSPAVADLIAQSPDSGAITFKPVYKVDIYDVYAQRRENFQGVLAEMNGKIVGLGVIGFENVEIEGKIHPAAYLFSLVVHPDHRRQGIARQLAEWRVNTAREHLGADAIIYANIQKGNTGSKRNAERWSNQFLEEIVSLPIKPLQSPPSASSQYIVRPAEPDDFESIAANLNLFYAGYHFYEPATAENLAHWQAQKIRDQAINQYWVVTDRQNNLMAGVGTTNQSPYMEYQVVRMPAMIRALNLLLKVVPSDGLLRQVNTEKPWFQSAEAAHYLWDSVRYERRNLGNSISLTYDPRGSLNEMFRVPGWMPRAHLGFAIYAPFTLSDRLLYAAI